MKTLTIHIPDDVISTPGSLNFRMNVIASAINLGFTEGEESGIKWTLKNT